MKGLFVAVALYFALSFATYDGTITPPKDSPAIREWGGGAAAASQRARGCGFARGPQDDRRASPTDAVFVLPSCRQHGT